jgi:bacillithiol biosynthesis deacetylase BshB1
MTPKSNQEPLLDCLAIGAHPDDAELFAGGTLALAVRLGKKVAIADLTRGEAATRGTPADRQREAAEATRILGVEERVGLDLGDADLANTQFNRRAIAELIRRLRPRLVLTHHGEDRHPDHRRASELVRDGVFLAHVGGFEAEGERWVVEALAYFLGNSYHPDERADWVVDVSETFEIKLEALRAYGTQFLNQGEGSATTYIGSHDFWDFIDRRARLWGHRIDVTHGEAFILDRPAHIGHPLARLIH